MKIELRYFSGTGNSWKILDTCGQVFKENGNSVSIAPLEANCKLPEDADIIGFCFPVYAFSIPRMCREFLKLLKKFKKNQNVFVLVTAGKEDESGFSIEESVRLLEKKNCKIIYSAVVEMPANWTTFINPPAKDEAQIIIEKGIHQAKEIGMHILNGINKFHNFNIPENYSRLKLYWEYYSFKYLGISNMWRSFKVYDSCNGCGICAKMCPTLSIEIKNNTPVWSSSCEQCMRCVNYCPKEAIFQSMGGDTKGRNRYHIPDFQPNQQHS
jgi:Pyruvate/2-oxoacid:ferredoxin oxidoreductase delta subunit